MRKAIRCSVRKTKMTGVCCNSIAISFEDGRWYCVTHSPKNIRKRLLKRKNDLVEAAKIGKRVAEFRADSELSQNSLADIMGTNQCEISKLENGKYVPSLQYIQRLAEALEVEVSDLVEV